MVDFNQEINLKKFDLNQHDFSPSRLRQIVLTNTNYTVIFKHKPEEKIYKLLIGLSVRPHSEETEGVEIKMFSHSTFSNETKLTLEELTQVFEKSIFELNEGLVRKLREIYIEIPHPSYKHQIKNELYKQYYEEYQRP